MAIWTRARVRAMAVWKRARARAMPVWALILTHAVTRKRGGGHSKKRTFMLLHWRCNNLFLLLSWQAPGPKAVLVARHAQ